MDNKFLAVIGIIMIIFICVIGFKFYNNFSKISNLESKIINLEKEIKETKEENNKLKEQLKNLNDPEYIEKIARKKLGLVKPGEVLLIPVEEKDKEDRKQGE